MATQHPDNAGKPYWHSRAFVSTAAEIKECYLCFSDLGIDEYNWDWEGKFVDEAVVDRLLHKHLDYFQKNPLGREKFLTFRIPNPRVEKQFRLARAFMVMITSSQLAQSLGFDKSPIFETILPLTETAEEVIDIQKAFKELVSIEHRLLKMEDSIKYIEIIPLFEQVDKIISSGEILIKYIRLHKKTFGFTPVYIRPYCARSDPALNSGLVPTILALKIALSSYVVVEKETGVKLYPILGTGSLPFRGGVTPNTIEEKIEEYSGIATLVLQSAFRYDYAKAAVKQAIAKLKTDLPKTKAKPVHPSEQKAIQKVLPLFENPYRSTIEKLAPLINILSIQVARRRERMLHIGLFGYSRGIGKVTLPRAIPFTASLYSLGIPPELIGTGRGIREAKKKGLWSLASGSYIHLKKDMIHAGYFLSRENVKCLAKDFSQGYDLEEDLSAIEDEFGIELGPKEPSHFEHGTIAQRLYKRLKEKKDVTPLITYGGILRKSLG